MGNGQPVPIGDQWWRRFESLMCELYREFGGDCSSLDWADGGAGAVEAVRGAFESSGIPPFPAPGDREDFIELVDSVEEQINKPAAPISAAVKASVQSLIDDIRAALDLG